MIFEVDYIIFYRSASALFIALLLFDVLKERYSRFLKWIPLGCIMVSLYLVLLITEKYDYAILESGNDGMSMVLLINIIVAIIPTIVSVVVLKMCKKS